MPYSVELVGADRLIRSLETAPEVVHRALREFARDGSLVVEAEAKAVVPRRTGRLFSSILGGQVRELGGGIVGVVAATASYAPMVEFGQRPHDIVPRNARALRIPLRAGGGFGAGRLDGKPRRGQPVAFFRRVHHPGARGRFFMRRGLERAMPAINELLTAAAHKLTRHIAGGA